MISINQPDSDIVEKIEAASNKIQQVRDAAASVIYGQDRVIEQTLITLLSGGHALLIGAPGVAKTSLVDTLSTVMGLDNKRIQFTPDLMPADIIGSEILEEDENRKREFRFIKGPVFTQLLMADEINRASPKTQSALLQAMQEHHVTYAGVRYDVPAPFHVLATQNPLEQEGTYPLPEAQLDRFLLQINVGYPGRNAEKKMLYATTGTEERSLHTLFSPGELQSAQRLVRQIPVGEQVVEAILDIVRAARPGDGASKEMGKLISWGPGPRAGQAFMLAVRARALFDNRLSPSIDDVIELAEPVLQHRMALSYSARNEGKEMKDIITALVEKVT